MTRRTSRQRELDIRADEAARRAKSAPKGRKLELRFAAKLARTEALKEGPRAKS